MLISRDWLVYQYGGLFLCVFACVSAIFLPESPKFLLAKGRVDEAKNVLRFVSRANGVSATWVDGAFLTEGAQSRPLNYSDQSSRAKPSELDATGKTQKEGESSGSIRQFLRNPLFVRNGLICVLSWIAGTFNYYLINFYMKYSCFALTCCF